MDTEHISELLARHYEEREGYREILRDLEKEIKRLEELLKHEQTKV